MRAPSGILQQPHIVVQLVPHRLQPQAPHLCRAEALICLQAGRQASVLNPCERRTSRRLQLHLQMLPQAIFQSGMHHHQSVLLHTE